MKTAPLSHEALFALLAGLTVAGCDKKAGEASAEQPAATSAAPSVPSAPSAAPAAVSAAAAAAVSAKEVPPPATSAEKAGGCAPGGCAPGKCAANK
jgi:hypothetical protein